MLIFMMTSLALFSGCNARYSNDSDRLSNVATLGISETDLLGCSVTSSLPKMIEIDGKEIHHSFSDLTPCQRRGMLIYSEGLGVNFDNRQRRASGLLPRVMRFLKVPKSTVQINVRQWQKKQDGRHFEFVEINGNLDPILRKSFLYTSETDVYIPVHPETKALPELIKNLMIANKIDLITTDSFLQTTKVNHAIATMSRSLWSFDPTDSSGSLYSVKMGTDTIHSAKNRSKLIDMEENLKTQIKLGAASTVQDRIESIGGVFLADTFEIQVSATKSGCGGCFGPKVTKYFISMRDYSNVIQDKSRVYMPSFHFYKDLAKLTYGNREGWGLPFSWSGQNFVFSHEKLATILAEINKKLGEIIAIYHMGGYFPHYLHGQNLLIGLPLAANIDWKILIRDVADVSPANLKSTYQNSTDSNAPGDPAFRPVYLQNQAGSAYSTHRSEIKNLFPSYLRSMESAKFMDSHVDYKTYLDKLKGLSGLKMLKCNANYEDELIRPFWRQIQSNEKLYWSEVKRLSQ